MPNFSKIGPAEQEDVVSVMSHQKKKKMQQKLK